MDRRCNIAVREIFPRARVTTREDYICSARSSPEEPAESLSSVSPFDLTVNVDGLAAVDADFSGLADSRNENR